jgi:PEGA domain-containing protein
MNLSKTLLITGLSAVLVGVAPSGFAQQRDRGTRSERGGRDRGALSADRGGVRRGESRAAAPRFAPAPRSASGIAGGSRAYGGVRGGYSVRGGGGRYSYAPAPFYRPYYSFRPRVSLGFGLWMGYPLAYSSAYYDPYYSPYGYGSPYAYSPYGYPATSYPGYPPSQAYPPSNYPSNYPPQTNYPPSAYPPDRQGQQGSIGVEPGQANTGGLSFEITPDNAELFVDGAIVGTVGQFTPTSQPLGLAAGRHRVELRAPGYKTTSFEVEIIAGQVVPYQGELER